MPLLSVRAKLLMRYTNHCVRATVVTDLKDAGFSNHEVCAVTGRKNEMSVQSYDRLDTAGSKRPEEMSSILDGAPPTKALCTPQQARAAAAPQEIHPAPAVSFPIGKILLDGNATINNLTINLVGTSSAAE